MNNLTIPEDKNKPSNCVSHHDDICFADHNHNEDKEDQD
jgi:hypothetical protein